MSKDNGKKFAIGALVAGVVGYLAGILTAPKSGKETRQDIQDKATQVKHEAEKKLKQLLAELDEIIAKAKATSGDITKKLGKDWDKALETATAAKAKVREVLSSIHEGDSDNSDLEQAISEANEAIKHLKTFLKTK